ncbi:MAG: Glu/Leu/Phe/Val dehydrogenase [bacterium]|nr:Glu/Leu/Phe/Val dehydrogenase [bacterium]
MAEKSSTMARLDEASDFLGLEPWLKRKFHGFKSVWECDIEAPMDDGSLQSFKACRAWHRSPFPGSPYKGGMRYHPDVTVEKMKDHAVEMSLKSWLMGLEFGGAKGGIAIDPSRHSQEELKRVTEALTEEMLERNLIGPRLDVPAPDVGTNPTTMNWFHNKYAQRARTHNYGPFEAVVTGKPTGIGYGGIPGRVEATGWGLVQVFKKFLKLKNLQKKDFKRIGVMGFGNVGYHVARILAEEDFTIVATSDVHGGVYNKSGIPLEKFQGKKDTREIKDCERITNDELLVLPDIDIFIPAALENVITKENAWQIKAKGIIEGANGPTTCEADLILESRGVFVIPDILANAGGVTVSFFEWARNMGKIDHRVPMGELTSDQVLTALSKVMWRETNNVFEAQKKYKVSMRFAAYLLALENVAPLFRTKHTAISV